MKITPAADLQLLRSATNLAVRAALESTAKYWMKYILPRHFKRKAFQLYPNKYSASAKRNREEWLKKRIPRIGSDLAERYKENIRKKFKNNKVEPGVTSGRLKRSMVSGNVRFSGGKKVAQRGTRRLSVRWMGLPIYANRKNPYSSFKVSEAVTSYNQREEEILQRVFFEKLRSEIKKKTHKVTHGFITLS